MNAIRIRRRLDSQVIDLPELAAAVGKNVEIIVLVEPEGASDQKIGPRAGSAKGKIWMAPDFDAPFEEFTEYME